MISPPDDRRDTRDLTRRSERLAAAMREFETLSLAVMHDFRMPLDAIEKRLLALAAGSLDAAASQNVLAIRDSIAVMDAMIGNLRDLYLLARGPLELETVDMGAMAVAAWEEIDHPKGVDFHIGTLPEVRGHREMLNLVWINLLRGAVRRSLSNEYPRVEVTGGGSGEYAVYSVHDNGTSLALEYAGKLFYVFEQIQLQTDEPGTGVELAIVQRIVTRHRGNIWVDAHRHKGAVFQFSLPVGDGQA